ncbi:unnamed protein product [Arctogadus glacialis]
MEDVIQKGPVQLRPRGYGGPQRTVPVRGRRSKGVDSYKHYKRFSYHKEEEMVVVVLGVVLGVVVGLGGHSSGRSRSNNGRGAGLSTAVRLLLRSGSHSIVYRCNNTAKDSKHSSSTPSSDTHSAACCCLQVEHEAANTHCDSATVAALCVPANLAAAAIAVP